MFRLIQPERRSSLHSIPMHSNCALFHPPAPERPAWISSEVKITVSWSTAVFLLGGVLWVLPRDGCGVPLPRPGFNVATIATSESLAGYCPACLSEIRSVPPSSGSSPRYASRLGGGPPPPYSLVISSSHALGPASERCRSGLDSGYYPVETWRLDYASTYAGASRQTARLTFSM